MPGGTSAPFPDARSSEILSRSVEATAYSSDWRSCGWEWGVALGPLPAYLPLCAGRRPSGTVAWPLVPRRRRDCISPASKPDLLLGGLALGAVFAASAFAQAALFERSAGTSTRGSGSGASKKGRGNVSVSVRRLLRSESVRRKVLGAACVGALAGGTQFPISRYWAETHLAGLKYQGTTASGVQPRRALPAITRHNPLRDPVGFARRLLTLEWGPRAGTVAADTRVFPLGTRVRVEGYGFGIVEDRGGAIEGKDRVDLYFGTRKEALEFGRRRVLLTVES